MFLQDFKVIRPKFESSQESTLEWIAAAHIQARMKLNGWKKDSQECRDFAKGIREKLLSLGLGEKKIQKRSSQLPDFFHENWEEMEIYNVATSPEGYHLDKRMEFFNRAAMEVFEEMYPIGARLPSHLVHVTCTGDVAPRPPPTFPVAI